MPVSLIELVYEPRSGHDVARYHLIMYNPGEYKTKEAAAKGLAQALEKWAVSHGYPEGTVVVWAPERTVKYSGFPTWCVVWEDGPYDWAVNMSMEIHGPWGFCEPYYGFDLHFTK